jgi:hypothetical protein
MLPGDMGLGGTFKMHVLLVDIKFDYQVIVLVIRI